MRLKLLAGLLGAVLAFSGGWQARGWFEDSQALAENERVLRATEEAYTGAIRMLYDELDAQADQSLQLLSRINQIESERDALREEVRATKFTPPVVDGCRRHVAADPAFHRLLTASGREARDAEAGSGGVSPRSD